jgi:O-acetyl-ADP-ribose deacetylase (regulator of RNase III)
MSISITHRKGDLVADLKSGRVALAVHQCNCMHAMGAGIAKVFSSLFPEVFAADLTTPKADKAKMGTASFAQLTPEHGKGSVGNVYSQYAFGSEKCHTEYDTIALGITDAIAKAKAAGVELTCIGIPFRYGSGLGGGDWHKVLIELEKVADLHPSLKFEVIVLAQFEEEAKQLLEEYGATSKWVD